MPLLPRAIVGAVVLCVAIALALIQFASDALYARAAPHAPVAHIPVGFGVRVYRALDAIAPQGFVEDALGMNALEQGDAAAAQRYALRMPPGPRRDELLAQIAQAQGQDALARQYYFAAADVEAMQREIMALAQTDQPAALKLESAFRERLIALGTHPDAVAQSYAISGGIEGWRHHYAAAFALNERALALAPLNVGYVLLAANSAYDGHDDATARRLFRRGIVIDPRCGNCYAGLGLLAIREGNRAQAQADLARALTVDPHAQEIAALERAVR
ncbi:MAG TPA: hypothetical protein VMF11_02085 [Candidatus Baltobacteraceae bacterium]|nr:hypothetical protein [Candidatus Baltobacteraceae bacterium]